MLKVDKKTLDHMESGYPGVLESILEFENAILPSCPHCKSDNTADVQVGIIGRTINIVAATTKVKLLANGPKPGKYYCHGCKGYFDDVPDMENMEVIKMEKKFRDEFKEMGIEVSALTKEEEESLETITYSVPKSVKSSKSPQNKDNTATPATGQKTARGGKKLMKRLNILVVENGRSQREMLRDFLLSEGHKVMEAENGERAIKAVLNGHPDLVLLDYKMPGMDGLEVLKEIKRTNPEIDVVIVTAYGTIETAVEAMKVGAMDYVTKPIELDELLALIDSVAERRQLLKTNVIKMHRQSPGCITANHPGITGGKADDITYFEVHANDTIKYSDFYEPKTRKDVYNLSLKDDVATPARLISFAEDCPPLQWEIGIHYSENREDPAHPDRLKSMPEEPEEGWTDWVLGMDKKTFSSLRKGIKKWLSEEPDWSQEEDYIDYRETNEGAVFDFFEGEPEDVLDALGVKLIESSYPGNNYRGAELSLPIDEANAIAQAKGLSYRFKSKKQETLSTREQCTFFKGYPYLVIRLLAGFFHINLLSAKQASPDWYYQIAQAQADANKLDVCLVMSDHMGVYFSSKQKPSFSEHIPKAGIYIAGRLRLSVDQPSGADLLRREGELEAFLEITKKTGYLLGDLTKGGRKATHEELIRLQGVQENKLPKGLVICPVCGDYRGECIDSSPMTLNLVVKVSCYCDNDNLCAYCGGQLHNRKLNANRYNPDDGHIWHTPSFSGLKHRCLKDSVNM